MDILSTKTELEGRALKSGGWKHPRLSFFIGVLVVSLLVAACTEKKTTTGASPRVEESPTTGENGQAAGAPKHCNTVSKADLEKAAGVSLTGQPPQEEVSVDGIQLTDPATSSCVYGGAGGSQATVVTTVVAGADYSKSKKYFDDATQEQGVERIPGLGDAAFWNPSVEDGALFVEVNDSVYLVVVVLTEEGRQKDASVKVARLVLSQVI